MAIKVLPKNIDNPDRPYTPEAESLLRNSFACNCRLFYSDKSISSAKISPNGKYLIASLTEYTYAIWDIANGKCINKNYKQNFATYVTFSKDGKRIATSEISSGVISIWDAKTNRLLQKINTGGDIVRIVEFYNNDRDLIIVTDYGAARIWNIDKNKVITEFGRFRCIPHDSDICFKKGLYCCRNANNHIVVVNVLGSIVFETKEEYSYVSYIAISDNGQLIGYITDKELFIWDIEKKKLVRKTSDVTTPVVSIEFNTNQNVIAIAYYNEEKRGIDIYDYTKWKLICHFKEDVDFQSVINFCKDDKSLLVCHPRNYYVKIYDYIMDNGPKQLYSHRVDIVSFGFNHSKNLLATADSKGNVFIWDMMKKKKLYSFKTHISNILSLMISRDDKRVIIASGTDISEDGGYQFQQKDKNEDIHWIVSIWDYNGNAINIIDVCESWPISAIFVKQGKYICSGSLGKKLQMWRNKKGNLLKTWEIDNIDNEKYCIEEKNNLLAVLQFDHKKILLYDLASGDRIADIQVDLKGDESINCISLSPNCNYVACGSDKGYVRIWETKHYKQIASWMTSYCYVDSIIFCCKEDKIFTLSEKTLKVWDVKTGRFIQTLDEEMGMYDYLFIVSNKRDLYLKSSKGIYSYSFMPLQELIDLAYYQLRNRGLTSEESRKYYLD